MELYLPNKLDCYKGKDLKEFYFYERRKGLKEDNPFEYEIFSHAYVSRGLMRTTLGPMRKI